MFDPVALVRWSLVLFVIVRLLVVATADQPTVTPDELGAWAIARALSGHDALLFMRDMPRYALVPGAVLAPVTWVDVGPVGAYRLALVVLSCTSIGAAAAIRRAMALIAPSSPLVGAAAFAMVLLYPATLVTGSFMWAEPTVLLWWSLLVLGVASAVIRRRPGPLVGTALVAGLAPFVHGRLVAVPLIWLATLAALAVTRRRTPAGDRAVPTATGTAASGSWLLGSALVTVLTALAGRSVDRWITELLWTTPQGRTDIASGLTQPDWWQGLVLATGGQVWYALASSAGLALLGGAALALRVRRDPEPAQRIVAGSLVTMLTATIAVSILSAAGGLASFFGAPASELGASRWDHVVYGRYIDAAVLVLCVLSLPLLLDPARSKVTRRWLLLSAALAAGLAAAVRVWLSFANARAVASLDLTIAGVAALVPGDSQLSLGWWTLAAVSTTAAFCWAAGHPRRAIGTLAAWLLVGAAAATSMTISSHRQITQPDLVGPLEPPTPAVATVVVAADIETLSKWRFGIFGQERDLTQAGWSIRFSDERSSAAASDLGDDRTAGAALLRDGVRPEGADWEPVSEFDGATLWQRRP